MGVDVTVRRAQASDVRALVELNALVQGYHVAHRPAIFKPADPAEVAAWFEAGVDAEHMRIWVATAADVVVGYLSVVAEAREEHVFGRARSWWEIHQIAVRPEWRRRGVARVMLQAAAADAERAGVGRLGLSSWSFNTDAQEAFRHLGFEPQTTRFELDLRRLTE